MAFLYPTLICILIGLGFLLRAFNQQKRARRSLRWTQTMATIIELDFEYSSNSDGDPSYGTRIIYEYNVGGKTYHSSNIGFGYLAYGDEKYHRRIYDILADKTIIKIYYDPHHPEKSTISRSYQTVAFYIYKSFGILFIYIGLFILTFNLLSNSNYFQDQLSQNLKILLGIVICLVFTVLFITSFTSGNIPKLGEIDQLSKDIMDC